MSIKIGQTVYLIGDYLTKLGLKYPIKAKVICINSEGLEVKTDEVNYLPIVDDKKELYIYGTESFIFSGVTESLMIRGI